MGYFDQFPLIAYQFANDYNIQQVTDIIRRVRVRNSIINSSALYDLYYVQDGETPENLAAKVYKDSSLFWVLCHTNAIINPYFDWPMAEPALNAFIINKYPGTYVDGGNVETANYYAIHHWELVSPVDYRNGMIMPSQAERDTYDSIYLDKLYNPALEQIIQVTNYEYEERLNDLNRQIKVFKSDLIPEFILEFSTLIKASS
jgi:hypothetical protein